MEIRHILTVSKARKIIREEIDKKTQILFKEMDKLRLKINDLENIRR